MGRIAHLLTQTATYALRTGRTGGNVGFGAQLTVACRHERESKIVIDADGEEKRANDAIYAETEIPIGSRVWVPGADTTDNKLARSVLAVAVAATPGGYTHYEMRI